MQSTLTGDHKATYHSLFRHPISHTIEWKDVLATFRELGDVEEESNGKVKFTRNGHTFNLHVHGKELGKEDVMQIRHFLNSSRSADEMEMATGGDLIVILDHKGARIFDSGSEAPAAHLKPEDPSGHDQHIHSSKGDDDISQRSHRKKFHENLAHELERGQRIVMIGDGHGGSSEIDRFLQELREHHKDVASRIVGTESLDLHHMSEGAVLAKGKELLTSTK